MDNSLAEDRTNSHTKPSDCQTARLLDSKTVRLQAIYSFFGNITNSETLNNSTGFVLSG